MISARSVVVSAGLVAACIWAYGAYGQPAPIVVTSAHTTSGYVARLRSRATWGTFPVRIAFVHDANYSRRRAQCAIAGFQKWYSATNGYVSVAMVNDPSRADVKIRFSPRDDNGFTTTRFRGSRLLGAHITIGVREGDRQDIEAVAAHEFGHALGIDGHSPDRHDLMYPYHYIGTPGAISARDLATLTGLYPVISTRRMPQPVDTASQDDSQDTRV